MSKTSLFDLGPEKLNRLLSIGKEEMNTGDDPGSKISAPTYEEKNYIEKPGSWIGRYKLIRMLGEGGMGMVYLAEQEQPIKRTVALKVVKPGMDSARVIARFEAERQALALLDHPNIAHVYDAGTTESCRPYFVMEFVEGLPITEHCDHHKLTIDDRLKLFIQICHAVHHAHQKGIIHRDIKPSNILVSAQDDQATPKIIDFGVAKAMSQPLTERTLITEQGRLFGTPEYMSPEQADMADNDIDTRSDIYSLGVLLYVLLTGVLPFDSKELRKSSIEHVRKVICETDPKTPSARLTKLGEEAQKIAESRCTEVAVLTRCLHRELEWIPLKAMRKERSDRYRSAAELADDIENYLEGRPLIAGPPSKIYRAKKFLCRHKALVGGVAAVLVVIVAGIIVSTLFAIGQAHARAEAQAVTDFLKEDVLGTMDDAGTQEVTGSYFLDAATLNLEDKFRDQPLVEASIRDTLGWIYRGLGETTKAQQHFEHAYEIRRQHLGDRHPDTINSRAAFGWIYRDQGRIDEAERLWTEQLEFVQREYGQKSEEVTSIMSALASLYSFKGKYKEAGALYEKILEISRQVHGQSYIQLIPSFYLAGVYRVQGRHEEAEQLFLKTLEAARQEWGPEDERTLNWTRGLAIVYRAQKRYDEAEQLLSTILEKQRSLFGDEHTNTLDSIHGLAAIYMLEGRFNEAESLFMEALEDRRNKLGNDHLKTLGIINILGVLRTRQGRFEEAESLLKEALEGRLRKLGLDSPETLNSKNDLAILYKEQARFVEAEPLQLEAVEGRIQIFGPQHPGTLRFINNLVGLYEAWNKPDQAEQWRAKLLHTEVSEQ